MFHIRKLEGSDDLSFFHEIVTTLKHTKKDCNICLIYYPYLYIIEIQEMKYQIKIIIKLIKNETK